VFPGGNLDLIAVEFGLRKWIVVAAIIIQWDFDIVHAQGLMMNRSLILTGSCLLLALFLSQVL
jgi:hypothetical protein